MIQKYDFDRASQKSQLSFHNTWIFTDIGRIMMHVVYHATVFREI